MLLGCLDVVVDHTRCLEPLVTTGYRKHVHTTDHILLSFKITNLSYGQGNGRSPVWSIMCRLREAWVVRDDEQPGWVQAKRGGAAECIDATWTLRLPASVNVAPQSPHVNGLLPK